jgi:hypothetical protein
MLIIFPNNEKRSSKNYNNAYYESNYWNETNIKENDDEHYTLAYSKNILLKRVKLRNIDSQFKKSTLDEGLFFYE